MPTLDPDALNRLAERYEPGLIRALTRAAAVARASVQPDRLRRAVERRRASPLLRAAWRLGLDSYTTSATTILAALSERASRATARRLGIADPRSLDDRAASWAARRARAVASELARRQVVVLTATAVGGPLSVRNRAALALASLGMSRRQARSLAAYAASLGGDDLSASAFEARLQARARLFVRTRGTRMARTEGVRAVNAAAERAIIRARDDGLITGAARKVWRATLDNRICPICTALDGQSRPLGQPFNSRHVGELASPPAHIQCRCGISLRAPAAPAR